MMTRTAVATILLAVSLAFSISGNAQSPGEIEFVSTPYRDKVLRYSRNVPHAAVLFEPIRLNLSDWNAGKSSLDVLFGCILGNASSSNCGFTSTVESQIRNIEKSLFDYIFLEKCHFRGDDTKDSYKEVASLKTLQGLNQGLKRNSRYIFIPYCHTGPGAGYRKVRGIDISQGTQTLSHWEQSMIKTVAKSDVPDGAIITLLDRVEREQLQGDIWAWRPVKDIPILATIDDEDGLTYEMLDETPPSVINAYLINKAILPDRKQRRVPEKLIDCNASLQPKKFRIFGSYVQAGKCHAILPEKLRFGTSSYFYTYFPDKFALAERKIKEQIPDLSVIVPDETKFCGISVSEYDTKIDRAFEKLIKSFYSNFPLTTDLAAKGKFRNKPKVYILEKMSPQMLAITNGTGDIRLFGSRDEPLATSNFQAIHDISVYAQFSNDFRLLSFIDQHMDIEMRSASYVPDPEGKGLVPNYFHTLMTDTDSDKIPSEHPISILSASKNFNESDLLEGPDNEDFLFVVSAGNDKAQATAGGRHAGDKKSFIVVGGLNYDWTGIAPGSSPRESIKIYAPSCGTRAYRSENGSLSAFVEQGRSEGTSAAAPYVSLTAALIAYLKPKDSASKIKDRILESSDIVEISATPAFRTREYLPARTISVLNMADAVSVNYDVIKLKGNRDSKGREIYGQVSWHVPYVDGGGPELISGSTSMYSCGGGPPILLESVVKLYPQKGVLRDASERIRTGCKLMLKNEVELKITQLYTSEGTQINIAEENIKLEDVEYFYNSTR